MRVVWAVRGLVIVLVPLTALLGSTTATASPTLPHEQIQIRPLGGHSASCAHDPRMIPAPSHRFALPNGGTSTGCSWVGPAVFATGSVREVVEGHSVEGAPLVAVGFFPKGTSSLSELAKTHPNSSYAVVLLGRVLGTEKGWQFADFGATGPFQIAGGLAPDSPLAHQVAEALRAPLHVTPPPECSDLCASPARS
jgi:hypothetical protein